MSAARETPEQGELIPAGVQPIRVTAYKTSDGSVHASRPEADAHEAMLSIKAIAEEFDPTSVIALSGFLIQRSVLLHSILGRLLKARAKLFAAPAGEV